MLHEQEEASDSSDTKKLDFLCLERRVALGKNRSAASITLVQIGILGTLGFSCSNAGVSWGVCYPAKLCICVFGLSRGLALAKSTT